METKIDLIRDIIDGVQELIRMNSDSAQGFRDVSKWFVGWEESEKFTEIAESRHRQAEELAVYVSFNENQPRRKGTYSAIAYRYWLCCFQMLTTTTCSAALDNVLKVEEELAHAYAEVLQQTKGRTINDIIVDHVLTISQQHEWLEGFRKSLGASRNAQSAMISRENRSTTEA